MEKQVGKRKVHNLLFIKTYLGFAVIILLFALILGVIYMRLYEQAMMESYREQARGKAESVAKRCANYFLSGNAAGWQDYLILLGEIERTEVWVVSNEAAIYPLTPAFALSMESFTALSSYQNSYRDIINNVFHNIPTSRTSFSEVHEMNVVTIGMPVTGINGEVAGGILLNTPVESQQEIINGSWRLIIISGVIALAIAFLAALLYVRTLSKPILKIRRTARKLAEGNYEVTTEVNRSDEIGDLAQTVDFLSVKLKENEIERKNLDQMRLDFFANVSHELRTPLTVVRAYTESLVDGIITDPEKVRQYYEKMLGECKGMERLVGDLLLLSKMQNPDFTVEKEPVNLVQIFEDLKKRAWAIGKEKNITADVYTELPVIMMLGDYDRLRQMFFVIIDNAVKFSPENSVVYIRVTCEEQILVSIRDEGIGISEEDQKYIFEKFYKSKLRENAKGSGLGLAIAKQIAIKHGGTIEMKSEVGKGTEILFTFPEMEESEKDLF
ncbi:MAG: HAMP domain-containing protein [Lachnospiraceae bacterium]|nr:HAMP domain-containing protein [Lachnospiraceae bacterium]